MEGTHKWPAHISSPSDLWAKSPNDIRLPASVPDLIWEHEIIRLNSCLFRFYYDKLSAYTLLRPASYDLPHYGAITKVEERAYARQRRLIEAAQKRADQQLVNSYNTGLRKSLSETSSKIINTRLNMIRKMLRGLQVPDGTFKVNGRTYEITDKFVDLVFLLFQIHDEDDILYRDIRAGKLSVISNKWMNALYRSISDALDASGHKDKKARKNQFKNGLVEKHARFKPRDKEINIAAIPNTHLSFVLECAGKYFAE